MRLEKLEVESDIKFVELLLRGLSECTDPKGPAAVEPDIMDIEVDSRNELKPAIC